MFTPEIEHTSYPLKVNGSQFELKYANALVRDSSAFATVDGYPLKTSKESDHADC
jgi:hypothetical protein